MSSGVVTVSVAVEKVGAAADKLYDYTAEGGQLIGRRVLVPFGVGNRLRKGIIFGVSGEQKSGLKPVAKVFDETASLEKDDLRLAVWMRSRCFCTFFEAADSMLPPGIWAGETEYFSLKSGYNEAMDACGRSEIKRSLIRIIKDYGQPMTISSLKNISGRSNIAGHLRELEENGVLLKEIRASSGLKESVIPWIRLGVSPDEAIKKALPGPGGAKRAEVVSRLAEVGELPQKELCYRCGVTPGVIKTLLNRGIVLLEMREAYRKAEEYVPEGPELELSPEQQAAYSGLSRLMGRYNTALLHGVTGSGKTAVYIRLLKKCLSDGKNAVLLVPEIALTPQMLRIFYRRFGDDVAIVHSGLTSSRRYNEYRKIKTGNARIVIGTRSAVLSPIKNIGVIIVDEEHDYSYRSDNPPRYDAIEVASYKAEQNGALLVLGSATPRISDMFKTRSGQYSLFTLSERFFDAPLPKIIISDMKKDFEPKQSWAFGKALEEEIRQNFKNGEQTILFLNRRGNSKMAVCTECGYTPQCPHCSQALIYHSKNGRLMCHHCGYSEPFSENCPVCGGKMKTAGIGTQKIEDQLSLIDPGIKVIRMDADTTVGRTSHEKLLDDFGEGRADVLVGTQMVTKGLDFENVTLVGVIDADMSLFYGDYFSRERTFALLTQVIGRAGRRKKQGRAVIQTFLKDDPVINAVTKGDYEGFYSHEIAVREAIMAPPFCDTAVICLKGEREEHVLSLALKIKKTIEVNGREMLLGSVLGPAPMPLLKVADMYRYTISFRTKDIEKARSLIRRLLKAVSKNSGNIGVWAEINPYAL